MNIHNARNVIVPLALACTLAATPQLIDDFVAFESLPGLEREMNTVNTELARSTDDLLTLTASLGLVCLDELRQVPSDDVSVIRKIGDLASNEDTAGPCDEVPQRKLNSISWLQTRSEVQDAKTRYEAAVRSYTPALDEVTTFTDLKRAPVSLLIGLITYAATRRFMKTRKRTGHTNGTIYQTDSSEALDFFETMGPSPEQGA